MHTIAITGLFNARAAGAPAWLIRAGAPDDDAATAAALREHGVTDIIDLREPDEASTDLHGIPVRGIALYGAKAPDTGRIETIYESLLRTRAPQLTAAVAAIADAAGAALVHCTAGKDRTGLVIALALAAVGADHDAIIADYARSGEHVRPVRLAAAERIAGTAAADERAGILRLHLDSPAEAMRHALAVVDELGGAEAYLTSHGLTDAQLRALRAKHTAASRTDATAAGADRVEAMA